MLNKLKGLFGLAPTVEYVDFEDGLLKVKSKDLAFDTMAVKVKTSAGTVFARVLVESYDENENVFRLKLMEKESVLHQLDTDRRENPRLPKVLRASSRHFPDYRGTTEDISRSGARILTSGPLELAHDIEITIELDDEEARPFTVYADVCWTGKKKDGSYHSGLKFQAMDPQARQMVSHYIQTRLKIEKKLHTLEETDPLV